MKPPKQGEQWTEDDFTTLQLLWETEAPLEDICQALGRSAASVVGQLAYKKYIYFSSATTAYYRVQPPPPALWTMREVREINLKVWDHEN